jgi:hypothetical protein
MGNIHTVGPNEALIVSGECGKYSGIFNFSFAGNRKVARKNIKIETLSPNFMTHSII